MDGCGSTIEVVATIAAVFAGAIVGSFVAWCAWFAFRIEKIISAPRVGPLSDSPTPRNYVSK